jgi:hypothetical protein
LQLPLRPSRSTGQAAWSRRYCWRLRARGACRATDRAAETLFDLASFDVLDADLPPRWLAGSDPRFLLGNRLARPRSL